MTTAPEQRVLPEIPEEVRELKGRIARFVTEKLHPFEEEIARYVWPVVRGETREAWAITEPEAGSDIKDIKTTAEPDGNGWVLNGEKWFVTGGERAGYFIVL